LKISLSRLLSGFLSSNQLNSNYAKIEDAFDNTLSRDGTAPNAMGAPLDMGSNRIINVGAPVDPNDAVRLADLAGLGGGSGGGSSGPVAWSDITGKPSTFTPDDESVQDIVGSQLVAGSNISVAYNDTTGKTTISASGSLAADWNTLVNKPSTFAPAAHTHVIADVTGLQSALDTHTTALAGKAATVHTHVPADITGLQEYVEDTVAAELVAGTNMTITYNDTTGKITFDAAGSGASGQKPVLLSSFGTIDGGGTNTTANDAAFTAAEASSETAIYIPDGTYATTKAYTFFTKRYSGSGTIKLGDGSVLPANFHYVGTRPSPPSGNGIGASGWWTGNQKFTQGPEWHWIGTDVREFDSTGTAKYYESDMIPHNQWFYVDSGNSGMQGFLTSGATAGSTTITINGAPSSTWVGKTVYFIDAITGVVSENKVISSVGPGNVINLSSGLTNNYTWNPSAGQAPGFNFAARTWNGRDYTVLQHKGGGDGYGSIVRATAAYVPKATEYHTFMTSTAGLYGGEINFSTSGIYATAWESMAMDNGNDVAHIGFVHSMVRSNDLQYTGGGRTWIGTHFKSEGVKPSDVGHNLLGLWRIGMDTSQSNFIETTTLVDTIIVGGTTIKVVDTNGMSVGSTIWIGPEGSPFVDVRTITAISGQFVTVNSSLPTGWGAGQVVRVINGGAAIQMGLGQKIVFNSTASSTARSGDKYGVYSTFYGNRQGDLIMESNTDGSGDYWRVAFNGSGHSGQTSHIRLRPTVVQINVPLQVSNVLSSSKEIVTSGASFGSGTPAVVFGSGSGNYITFSGGQFQFYKANSLAYSI
jgi:hypothetical protein